VPARLAAVVLLCLSSGCARRTPDLDAPAPSRVVDVVPSAAARSWYLRAIYAEERGDLETADRAWAWVAREDARDPHAHAYRARFLQRQRRWNEAEAAWLRAQALAPGWWEPYAALAALAGHRGDAPRERALLGEAVERGADGATIERLVELHERAGDRAAANGALDAWLALDLTNPRERWRRGMATLRLDRRAEAIPDLRAAAASDDPSTAMVFLDEARAACRLDEALAWARGLQPADPAAPLGVEAALAAGDLPTAERLLGLPGGGEVPAGRPPRWESAPLAAIEAPDMVRVAEGWWALGRPDRAAALLSGEHAAWGPVLRTIHAGGPLEAAAGPAGRVAAALALLRGTVGAEALLAATVGWAPERLATLLGRLPGADGAAARVIEGEGAVAVAGGAVLVLPAAAHAAWLDARDAAAPSLSAARAAAWTERSPGDPRAWTALAVHAPDRAVALLDRALAADPCHAPALRARAALSAPDARVGWEERARQADPLGQALPAAPAP
jgi:tetratricopeptide (TPR) repeat protein